MKKKTKTKKTENANGDCDGVAYESEVDAALAEKKEIGLGANVGPGDVASDFLDLF